MPCATLGTGAGVTPVMNTWYTVLDTTKNISVLNLNLRHVNNESASKNLGVRLTIDGVVIATDLGSCTNNVTQHCKLLPTSDEFNTIGTNVQPNLYVRLNGKSVKVEARTTTAVGTNPLLFATVQYEQLERIKIT